jgi:hypothetical protein
MDKVFYYTINGLLDRIKNYSLYHEDARDKQFDDISIGNDDYSFVKTLLEISASEVYSIVQSMVPAEVESGSAFGFDEPCMVNGDAFDGDLWYYIVFPDNFRQSNIKTVDNAIKECLCHKTLFEWVDKKGRFIEKIFIAKEKSESRLKEEINYRTNMSLEYRRY